MTYVKWAFTIAFWVIVAAFLHYTLPQHDIVRISDTYEKKVNPGENKLFWAKAVANADGTMPTRDVFFIQTSDVDGDIMVYRNEDTGWGWPPYFKFDTANLHAESADLKSTVDAPRWVAVRHYGWRNEFMSIYPNALSVREVESPDVRIIPWMNIAILSVLFAAFWAIRVRWNRFQANRIDPMIEEVGDRIDDGGSWFKRTFGGKS